MPEHIRASLAQYSKHQQCTCLECGYSGLMGVHREADTVSNSKAAAIFGVITALFILYDIYLALKGFSLLPWWILVIVFFCVSAYQLITKQVYLACPNCNLELKVK